ncbi:MAG: ABC transporter ATP-binding protein [Halioglobus sp.]|nr:ABC transporter ATP-binding protein [Halioglobus sp.]
MLKINHLSVHYGNKRVVNDINLELTEDEILMLVGPTGCGKTTILHAVAGLVPIADGSVALHGWSASSHKSVAPEQRNVGMVFQDFALFPHLTVEENVCFRLTDRGAADHWLRLLGLSALRQAKPGRLSGGQKQRVALARALAHEPALMLLDEPLSNLDASLKDSLRWEIRNALKAAAVPAIWVTHDQHEALSVGDRLGVLRNGQLVQLDSPEQCFFAPRNRFVATFLGEASFLPAQLAGSVAHSALGDLPARPLNGASKHVDLLLRPTDCSLLPMTSGGNGALQAAQFEGNTWLYTVQLDAGCTVRVRTDQETRLTMGDRVTLAVTSTRKFIAFGTGTD